MKTKLALLGVLVALAVWWAGPAWGQAHNLEILNGPTVQQTTPTSATISWTTNVQSSATVNYGTDKFKLDQTANAHSGWGGTNHTVQLNNLKPGTRYYYQVISGQGLGTGSGEMSGVLEFTTPVTGGAVPGGPQAAAQESGAKVVAGPIVEKIKPNSAIVWWQTNAPAASTLEYGTDAHNLSQTAEGTGNGQSHMVELKDLKPGTEYFVSVRGATRRDIGFTNFRTETGAVTGFQITDGPLVEMVTANEVVVAWTTNQPSDSVVKYGTNEGSLSETAQGEAGTTHRVHVKNLQSNQKYWFEAESQNQKSALFSVVTLAPGQQPMRFNTR